MHTKATTEARTFATRSAVALHTLRRYHLINEMESEGRKVEWTIERRWEPAAGLVCEARRTVLHSCGLCDMSARLKRLETLWIALHCLACQALFCVMIPPFLILVSCSYTDYLVVFHFGRSAWVRTVQKRIIEARARHTVTKKWLTLLHLRHERHSKLKMRRVMQK